MADTSEHQPDLKLKRQIRNTYSILMVLLVAVLLGPIAFTIYINARYPSISTITIENVRILGDDELCPKDELRVSYKFIAEGSGVLVRDSTIWTNDPPRTIIFSSTDRFILEEAYNETLVDSSVLPDEYINPDTGNIKPLPPGSYRRIISISSPARRELIAIGGVGFSVKDDCT